ncbi:MOSC domain-containing protein [Catenovulum maritimum]|uniref:MOSC domain-containing protein n=1 Tax=Catenovulum maritimum TaxID=1513271 RepID=A0A0J8GYL9_9ALTE|nr:MOSC domain-containing protein [Catenovulum maritimum]KMT65828.1 hypothetical protein XM47_07470 [Catenovulum maritimum]
MKLLAISTAKKKTIPFGKKTIETGIFKQAATGPKQVFADHIEGDEQADLKNHGGFSKAVYAYGFQHYPYWQKELSLSEMPYGSFGENLTIETLDENEFHIGDKYQLGDTVLVVSQPRVPCFKLGIKFDLPTMPKLFSKSLKTGIYFSVEKTGKIDIGDSFRLIEKAKDSVSVQALFAAFFHQPIEESKSLLTKATNISGLSPEWRQQIISYLDKYKTN